MPSKSHRKRWMKILVIAILATVVIGGGVLFGVRRYYNENLKPVSSTEQLQEFTIPVGSALPEIAESLKEATLIRNKQVFQQYVRNNGADADIKAGTYELSPSYSVQDIVEIITEGKIASNLITIPPGVRIDEIKEMLLNKGFSASEVDIALDPASYPDHPALVAKPKDATLEGYLYPESFQRTTETKAQEIIELSLDEMNKRLTPSIQEAFASRGFSTHQAIILSSIVEKEVSNANDRRQVAQVFLKRLGIPMNLESDATAKYGAVLAGIDQTLSYSETLSYNSPYNTYQNSGLPPGPISNVTESALNAVANPSNTDWLYFVSGDDGTTYFSNTLEQHQELTRQYCQELCGN
ncbi:endolytic transglycosylase MltG [Candidatus Saccharibacteria bacterium]|nr:endolytic transglycosylase MltG [Candidatus Saccharibacteria bacterium]